MAKYTAKGASITLTITGSATNVSNDCEAYEIKEMRVLAESSGFGEIENYVEGQYSYEVTLDTWFGVSGTTAGLFNLLRIAKANVLPVTVSIKPQSSTQTFSGVFTFDGYAISGNKKGETIKLGKVTFKPLAGNPEPTWS